MTFQRRIPIRISTLIRSFLIALPVASQAASDEDLVAMRVQLQALSERLDRLEAENRALTNADAGIESSDPIDSNRLQPDLSFKYE